MFLFKEVWDDIYHFTDEDLKANAFGSMSEKQQRGYHFMIYRWIAIGLPITFVIVGLVAVLVTKLLYPSGVSLATHGIYLGMVGFITAGSFIYFIVFWLRLRSDYENNNVINVSGAASIKDQTLKIGDVTFRTNLATWFQSGKNYRVYYLPKSKAILSVEELS